MGIEKIKNLIKFIEASQIKDKNKKSSNHSIYKLGMTFDKRFLIDNGFDNAQKYLIKEEMKYIAKQQIWYELYGEIARDIREIKNEVIKVLYSNPNFFIYQGEKYNIEEKLDNLLNKLELYRE